jgi:hypothetical protein
MEELARKHGNMLTHWAVQENRFDVLEWALQHGHDLFSSHVQFAVDGRLDALMWMKDHGVNIKKEVVTLYASIGGHLHILEWLKTQGFITDLQKPDNLLLFDKFCTYTSLKGKLNSLQWLRNNGFPWDEMVCKVAAQYGHLHVLQWAREHGCPWNEYTCEFAALNGYLHVLLWALQNNCPLPTQPITIQFQHKYFTVTKKLLLHHNRYNLQFANKQLVEAWIQSVDDLCSDLCYNDLSMLIKSFI